MIDLIDACAISATLNARLRRFLESENVDDEIRPVGIYTKQTFDYDRGEYVHVEPSILFCNKSGASLVDKDVWQHLPSGTMSTISQFRPSGSCLTMYLVLG